MLKWTVMSRRDTAVKPDRLPSTPSSAKAKRRRSTSTRRSRNSLDALEADKENQFTSTPIKADGHVQFEALRDVSNLTPKDREQDRRVLSAKKCKSTKKPPTSPTLHHKKKKDCLSAHYDFLNADSQTSNYFRPFETVDSHIEGVLDENLCHCKKSTVSCDNKRVPDTYAPTLPTFATDYSPCTMRTTHCLETLNRTSAKKVTSLRKLLDDENIPPTKKPKVDHVEDFLHQITFLTSPDTLPGFKSESSTSKKLNLDSVTPLVKKFLDFKFTIKKQNKNNSSYINDLSLDKIVDAILDSSDDSIRATVRKSLNTSLIVNVESENNMNESQEENMINIVKESKNALENVSENSSDSGFRSSTTENSHALDNNFVCKCNNNVIEKTIIQIDEQYNERCVDPDTASRKRSSSTSVNNTEAKKIHLDCSQENLAFTLKRQKCIRRRKPFSIERSPFSANKNLKFESTPIRNCYLETKEILSDSISLNTPNEESRGIRRCLLFDSPKISDSLSFSESTSTSKSGIVDVRGSMDLRITAADGMLLINVIRCKDLYRPNGEKINAYVKVCISDRLGDSRRKKNAILQRTAVQGDSSKPIFNHIFKFPLVNENSAKRVHLEVWHRDRCTRTSEFLGCMSFDVKYAIKAGISGSFRLLPQTTGRSQNEPITSSSGGCEQSGTSTTKMCDGNSRSSVCEELISLDDADGFDLSAKSGTAGGCNRIALSEQQKYADENLFLRYLELDPTEGPDASSAATQRKATGNRNGRTPFTHTKRLIRPPKSGFGFSVVWTHPPRIERVEKGLPADKAGILPGDYIIFVDKHNIVMMPEIDILNLIRSYGNQLTLEIFRRNPSRNGSVPNVKRLSSTPRTSTCTLGGGTLGGSTLLPVVTTPSVVAVQRRPSTVCSTNTASVDYGRRRLHLPQVTFSSEKPASTPEENRKKAMYQLISKEQQYATGLQFAITRFVSALAERKDLITPSEHRTLFQNCEEILRITEDILDTVMPEDGDPQFYLLVRTYHMKLHEITSAYKRYCSGIKKADCILANKTKNSNSDFTRFLQVPQIPRRRPDITTFIHKPLEHYRDILRLLTMIQGFTKPNHEDFPVINQIVHDLQLTYREITSSSGLMEPVGEGRPLLTVQDLENRLVFTKCKPFVLNKPGRQWIFGGDLSRIEGRNVRQYWTLLFSDLLLFAKASRDRVLFVIEDPLPLAHVSDMFFNVRKKDTEFRLTINPEFKKATSPTVHCGPDLSRTPRKNANKKTLVLRAPTPELKAVWQNLLQRQIYFLNSGMDSSSVSSPLESPEAPITSSVVTLQSAESLSTRRQTPQNLNQLCQNDNKDDQKILDAVIEHKCKLLRKTSLNSKYNAFHLEQWMKGQLDCELPTGTPDAEFIDEEWTAEMLRKRSVELQLIDSEGNVTKLPVVKKSESRCEEEIVLSDQSPSKSTTTESQVTVRSSPLVPETVPVCRQCHKNCLSNNGTNSSIQIYNDCNSNKDSPKFEPSGSLSGLEEDDWQPLMLLGLMANPAASLVNLDPFSIPSVPNISVMPATPENTVRSTGNELGIDRYNDCHTNDQQKQNPRITALKTMEFNNELDVSPDDSPQTDEHPYHSLSSSVATLRRFGTVSSLERVASDEQEENVVENGEIDGTSDDDEGGYEDENDDEGGIDNEAFNHSAIRHWTIRAGTFVAEKMAFFEKLGEDCKSGGFFDRYLKSNENHVNGDEQQEDETSGATSGEEIWGTPTSGGEIDENLSPGYEGKQSPNDGSISSDYGDDTELMMDELLMTPPITGAIMRGLLPRRTLEPLIEEEGSETSSSSIESTTEPSVSPEEGIETGAVADTCSAAAEDRSIDSTASPPPVSVLGSGECPRLQLDAIPTPPQTVATTPTQETAETAAATTTMKMHRSESYRHIVEAAEDSEGESEERVFFFNRFRPMGKFVNVERVPRSKSIKIFEFFNVRKPERRIYETFPEGRHLLQVFEKESAEAAAASGVCSPKPLSPRRLKNKQLDRRFWKQLSRRRGSKVNAPA